MSWSLERAERHLLSLELFGMSFGLERMRRLLTALDSPQRAFRAVHVVGTNGKSSTTRMTAALLEAHGHRTGAYLSPHLTSFTERVRVADADVAPTAFAAAVERTAEAARKVERGLRDGEVVTQFELLTAAAFVCLADAGVEWAVIEAGLGGRYDATNVLDAPVVVLTNVGLEHTRWLGPTIAHIAAEKLAVVHPDATLVLGPVQPEVAELAAETGATITPSVQIPAPSAGIRPLGVLSGYQRWNFAAAEAAARAAIGELDPDRVADVAARVSVPGRLQTVGAEPLTILDGAHNPAGMEALAQALPDAFGERPVTAVVSILDDKDATGMLKALLPHCAAVVYCASRNPRALPPATLASLTAQLQESHTQEDGERLGVQVVNDPHAALHRARELAGPQGGVLATGSIYLIADLVAPAGRTNASAL